MKAGPNSRRALLAGALRGDPAAISHIRAEKDPGSDYWPKVYGVLTLDEKLQLLRGLKDVCPNPDEWRNLDPLLPFKILYKAMSKTMEQGRPVAYDQMMVWPSDQSPEAFRVELFETARDAFNLR